MRAGFGGVFCPLLLAGLAACNHVGTSVLSQPVPPQGTPPSITTQPADQSISAGNTATFSVIAAGSAPLSYQWGRNGAAIAGATAASYTTPAATAGNDGDIYTVVVSNSAGSVTSAGARLSVSVSATAPAITSQPSDASIVAGQTATYTVVATGTAPLSYQWQKNGAPIAGATSASYTTAAETMADNGATFAVVVSNSAGSVTSRNAMLTVSAASTAPSITVQPSDQTVRVGQRASFSVAATGTAPLAYQWRKNGTAIAGATSASYTSAAVSSADNNATFSVVVSNSVGSATSRNARLTVLTQGTDVLTYKNDLARTGLNPTETVLTLTNVNSSTFGLLRTLPVDGKVDAQPLYLSQLSISGSPHNVVFVATENDSVYAFDADSGATLWQASLLGSGETPSPPPFACDQIAPTLGITATPVIDRSAGAIYLVAASSGAGTDHQRLHALDVTSGRELLGGPREITATYLAPGGATRTFNPGMYAERAALLLSGGVVYTSWTSHCDVAPYQGWIIAYSASTLAQTAVLNVAPNATGTSGNTYATAGPAIWMSGGGPAADGAGNIYLLTGNGAFETPDASGFPSNGDYGNSFLRLATVGGKLVVSDYFAMFNEVSQSSADNDLGSGGAMLLPDLTDAGGTVRHLAVGAGKDGNLYVVNRDSMGRYNASGNNIWQELQGTLSGGIWSTPAWFNGTVYYGPVNNNLLAFPVTNARLATAASSGSSRRFTYPGTAPAVSANGTGNGIVWAHENTNPAVLHAYDATNLARELYNSSQAAGGRDQFGAGNKFITPAIADGKVFVGTTGSVAVFGLR